MNAAAASSHKIALRRGLAAFTSFLTGHGDLGAQSCAAVYFIGMGDLLDDDRRLVREDTSLTSPAASPASPDAPRFG
jgi:hypothetical protein